MMLIFLIHHDVFLKSLPYIEILKYIFWYELVTLSIRQERREILDEVLL